MGNPMRAEAQVSIAAGTFTLAYSLNALSAIKAARPDVPLNDLLAGLEGRGADAVEDIALLIWAGLLKHHSLSIEEVGDLVEISDMPSWTVAIGAAMGGGAPEAKPNQNPRKAAAKR